MPLAVRRSRCLEAEEVVNECNLPGDVILSQPPDLSLTNRVHRFDSLKCSAGRVEGPESLTRSDPPLDGSVILLDHIVRYRTGLPMRPSTIPARGVRRRHSSKREWQVPPARRMTYYATVRFGWQPRRPHRMCRMYSGVHWQLIYATAFPYAAHIASIAH